MSAPSQVDSSPRSSHNARNLTSFFLQVISQRPTNRATRNGPEATRKYGRPALEDSTRVRDRHRTQPICAHPNLCSPCNRRLRYHQVLCQPCKHFSSSSGIQHRRLWCLPSRRSRHARQSYRTHTPALTHLISISPSLTPPHPTHLDQLERDTTQLHPQSPQTRILPLPRIPHGPHL